MDVSAFDLDDDEDLDRFSNNRCKHISDVVDEYLEQLEYEYQNPNTPRGLCTGIKKLDEKLGGFKGGDVILVGGRPAMGKTSFAVNCAYNIASKFHEDFQKGKEEKSVLFFSFECPFKQLIARFIQLESKLFYWHLRENLNYELFEKAIAAGRKISKLPLQISDSYGYTIDELKENILKLKKQANISFIVIDYLQLLFFEQDDFIRIVREIKKLALNFDVPILLLSQLNRNSERRKDKRPLMSDLRGFPKRALDFVDVILFLYREYYYSSLNEPKLQKRETEKHFQKRIEEWEKHCLEIKHECEIIIAKNRHGTTGFVKCFCDLSYGKFDNLGCDNNVLF